MARVILDIFCKHTDLPTTIRTDLGTQFNHQELHEVTVVLDIELKHATIKYFRTIGLLERTHASVQKTQLTAATGDFRHTWQNFLPLVVLNHNTTWHASFGCEPYDRKAKASPLESTDYCYTLHPNTDTRATEIPFRNFRWQGPYKVEKVLPNSNYKVSRLGTNKTQLLHRQNSFEEVHSGSTFSRYFWAKIGLAKMWSNDSGTWWFKCSIMGDKLWSQPIWGEHSRLYTKHRWTWIRAARSTW